MEILKYPNPILKKKAEEIREITPEIKELALNMAKTMKESHGVGLAAPQVGVLKRLIVVQTEKGPEAFINPKITKKSRQQESAEEGCLCFPGVFLNIKRAKNVEVEAVKLGGKKTKMKAAGIASRIFQHEIDHLDGKLIIDKIWFWQRRKLKKSV